MLVTISQKTRYALSAVVELARHQVGKLVKVADIARRQSIPPRFLEVILVQLKRGGIVLAKRGHTGGYRLARLPETIPISEILQLMHRPISPGQCNACAARCRCALQEGCVFRTLWRNTQRAVLAVLDATTIQDLVRSQKSPLLTPLVATRDQGRGCQR